MFLQKKTKGDEFILKLQNNINNAKFTRVNVNTVYSTITIKPTLNGISQSEITVTITPIKIVLIIIRYLQCQVPKSLPQKKKTLYLSV